VEVDDVVADGKDRRSKQGSAGRQSRVRDAARRWERRSRQQSSDEEEGRREEHRREKNPVREEDNEGEVVVVVRGKVKWDKVAEGPPRSRFAAPLGPPRSRRWRRADDPRLVDAVKATDGDFEEIRKQYFPEWTTVQLRGAWEKVSTAEFSIVRDEQIMRAITRYGDGTLSWAARDLLIEFRAQHPTIPLPPHDRVPLDEELVVDFLAGLRETDELEWGVKDDYLLEEFVETNGYHRTRAGLEFRRNPLDVCKRWLQLHPGSLTSFGL
jgi:hypothetical protein